MPFRSKTNYEKASIFNPLAIGYCGYPLLQRMLFGPIALYCMNDKQPKDNENSKNGYSYGRQ